MESGREKDKMLKVLQVNLALFPLVHLQLFKLTKPLVSPRFDDAFLSRISNQDFYCFDRSPVKAHQRPPALPKW